MGIYKWVGGKVQLLSQLGPSLDAVLSGASIYHEPYLGGGAVLLDVAERYPGIHLSVSDADIGVSSVWEVVVGSERKLRELELLLDVKPTLGLRDQLLEEVSDDPVRRAWRTIFVAQTSFSGCMTGGPLGGRRQNKNSIGDRYNPKSIIKKLHRARGLLRDRLDVYCMDGVKYMQDVVAGQSDAAASYLDPPYLIQGRNCYAVWMTEDEHRALAAELRRQSGWVLSLDDCDLARDLYADADIRTVEVRYSIARATSAKRKGRTELVITPAGQGCIEAPQKRNSIHAKKSVANSPTGYLSLHTNSEVTRMSKTSPVGQAEDRPYDSLPTVAIPRVALSKEEAAVMCGVSTRTVDGWIEKGLKVRMLGKSMARITLTDLNEFLQNAPTV